MSDIEKEVTRAIHDGIREGVKSKLGGYNSPLDKMINECLQKHDSDFRNLLLAAIQSAVGDDQFRESIQQQVRHKLANVLVARFGGELERQVNALKSDPATRARITLAIEEIVKERSTV
jgi:hypothetical protein